MTVDFSGIGLRSGSRRAIPKRLLKKVFPGKPLRA
jgi:hypothetical protein